MVTLHEVVILAIVDGNFEENWNFLDQRRFHTGFGGGDARSSLARDSESLRNAAEIGRGEVRSIRRKTTALSADANEAQASIREYDDNDRQSQLTDQREIVHHHEHASVTHHCQYRFFGRDELCGNRGWNSETHTGETVGHQEGTGFVASPELAHHQLVRSDVAG